MTTKFEHYYYGHTIINAVVNTNSIIAYLYNHTFLSRLLDPKTKAKTKITDKCTHEELTALVSSDQLLKQYGGDLEEVDYFWPPYEPNDKYDVDDSKLSTQHDEAKSEVNLDEATEHHTYNDHTFGRASLKTFNSKNRS